VHAWRYALDPKLDRPVHTAPANWRGHALLSVNVAYTFQALRVSAAIWEHGHDWLPIYSLPGTGLFEYAHGKGAERVSYNRTQLTRACRSGKSAIAEHAGHSDVFVPVKIGGKVVGVLVVGPFLTARPTSAQIQQHFFTLTGRQGHVADPEFASYLEASFAELVLEGDAPNVLRRLLENVSLLLSGEGDAAALTNRINALRAEIDPACDAERAWDAAQAMVDDRTSRMWESLFFEPVMRRFGLVSQPNQVSVGLCVDRRAPSDPVDEAVRRHMFQRAAVELAFELGNTLAGRVGEQGVVFLSVGKGSPAVRRAKTIELYERAAELARRKFDLTLHMGMASVPDSATPSRSYPAALGAAEAALAHNEKWQFADRSNSPAHSLRTLRAELAKAVEERPELIGPRFEQFIQTLAAQTGYRLEPARAQLEFGFERMTESLLRNGALDRRSFDALCATLDRSATDARSTQELFAAYRRAALDVAEAMRAPIAARQDRSLRLAVEYLHQHYGERIRLSQVARVAGFSPSHFSKLFIQRERVSFEHYLRNLRLERAKQLLEGSDLGAARVAELAGFGSAQYFSDVFRDVLGMTPLAYRKKRLFRRKRPGLKTE
jgi:AraC-like DNA-binding protein